MHHYRQALLRMRQGESDREIAAAKLMGRRKAAQWRGLASARGWLDVQQPLPDDETIAKALGGPRRASTTISSRPCKIQPNTLSPKIQGPEHLDQLGLHRGE